MGDEAEQTEETTPREMNADPWQDHIRLSEFEPRFICTACGGRGADIKPDLHWDKPAPLVRLCWSFVPDELTAFASKKPND